MSVTLSEILDDVRRRGANVPPETITYLGLLLEREAMSRYDDPLYEKMYMPRDWLELRLTKSDCNEIVDVLGMVLDQFPRLASTAAFALGKAGSAGVVNRLLVALHRYWNKDDETAYQLLVALDNLGTDQAAQVVDLIANMGLPKSGEFARSLQQVAANKGKHE